MATRTLVAGKSTLLAKTGSTPLGGGEDNHLPVGYYGGYHYMAMIRFVMNWSDVKRITKAELYLKTSAQTHVNFGADPDIRIKRLILPFTANSASHTSEGGSGWSGANDDYDSAPATTGVVIDKDVTTSAGTWMSKDITAIVEQWAPSTVEQSDGSPGPYEDNYGIRLAPVVTGSTAETTEFYSMRNSSGKPYIKLTYTTNTIPEVFHVSPVGGATVTTLTPSFNFIPSDDDGDSMTHYRIIVSVNSNLSSPIWDTGSVALGTFSPAGTSLVIPYTGSALSGGVPYYWSALVYDGDDWSELPATAPDFIINVPPTATPSAPLAGGLAYIHNLADVALWTSGGTLAKPRLEWTYADTDGDSQAAYQIQVGTTAGGSEIEDTGEVAGSGTSHDLSSAIKGDGTIYYWRVRVKDSRGEWGAYSSNINFKVRWSQAIYEYAPTAGALSSQWAFSAAGSVAGTQHAAIFATATGASGAGRSAWNASIGALTPAAYVNVLVRLSTQASGTTAQLSDMTFSYVASSVLPRKWAAAGVGTSDWILDSDTRRYGTRSFKCAVTTSSTIEHYIYPFLDADGDDIPVIPGRVYTYSTWVKTDGALDYGEVSIQVYSGWSSPVAIGAAPSAANDNIRGLTTDTSGEDDGWQRLSLSFECPSGVYLVRPIIIYDQTVATPGDVFWIDAVKLEESSVATPWGPGLVGRAIVLDAGGVSIDNSFGGIFQVRSGDGLQTIEIAEEGLAFAKSGNAVIVTANAENILNLGDDTLAANAELIIAGGTTAAAGGKLTLLGGSSDADASIEAISGEVVVDQNILADNFVGTDFETQTFTADGTWTKPTGGYRWARILCIGAGGGGGSGRRDAAGTKRVGGGGGGGGGVSVLEVPFASLASSYGVTVGGGGAGGAGHSNNGTSGNAGTKGGDTYIGATANTAVCGAEGGYGGAQGLSVEIRAARGGQGTYAGAFGGAGDDATGEPAGRINNLFAGSNTAIQNLDAGGGAGGGGGGGGLTTGDAESAGGAGNSPGWRATATASAGGALPSTAATAGHDGSGGLGLNKAGGGGGGGTGTIGADTGNAGANGGDYGGGGGGGGGQNNVSATAAGGDGADGYVVVICY